MFAQGIPAKGSILTQMSAHWFKVLQAAIPTLQTHFVSLDLPSSLADQKIQAAYRHRSTQVRRLQIFPIECVSYPTLTNH